MKAGFDSERINANFKTKYEDITSIVVSNYGAEEINVIVRGVKRPVPPVHETLNVPIAPFRIESFGNEFDVEISVEFPGGVGDAIIDTIKIQKC